MTKYEYYKIKRSKEPTLEEALETLDKIHQLIIDGGRRNPHVLLHEVRAKAGIVLGLRRRKVRDTRDEDDW
jgi:hypothetical protein